MPVGPQAQVSRSRQSGTRASSSARSSMPSVSVCRSSRRIRPSAASSRSSSPKMTSAAVGAECTTTTSASSSRWLRSMPMTGVMPLPAVRNRPSRGGRRAGRSRRWPGRAWMIVPGSARRTRWLLTLPSGIALTVTLMQPSVRPRSGRSASRRATGGRRRRRCRSRMYWPGTWPSQPRPGRITRVTASRGLAAGRRRSGRAGRRRSAAGRSGRGSRRAAAGWSPARPARRTRSRKATRAGPGWRGSVVVILRASPPARLEYLATRRESKR